MVSQTPQPGSTPQHTPLHAEDRKAAWNLVKQSKSLSFEKPFLYLKAYFCPKRVIVGFDESKKQILDLKMRLLSCVQSSHDPISKKMAAYALAKLNENALSSPMETARQVKAGNQALETLKEVIEDRLTLKVENHLDELASSNNAPLESMQKLSHLFSLPSRKGSHLSCMQLIYMKEQDKIEQPYKMMMQLGIDELKDHLEKIRKELPKSCDRHPVVQSLNEALELGTHAEIISKFKEIDEKGQKALTQMFLYSVYETVFGIEDSKEVLRSISKGSSRVFDLSLDAHFFLMKSKRNNETLLQASIRNFSQVEERQQEDYFSSIETLGDAARKVMVKQINARLKDASDLTPTEPKDFLPIQKFIDQALQSDDLTADDYKDIKSIVQFLEETKPSKLELENFCRNLNLDADKPPSIKALKEKFQGGFLSTVPSLSQLLNEKRGMLPFIPQTLSANYTLNVSSKIPRLFAKDPCAGSSSWLRAPYTGDMVYKRVSASLHTEREKTGNYSLKS